MLSVRVIGRASRSGSGHHAMFAVATERQVIASGNSTALSSFLLTHGLHHMVLNRSIAGTKSFTVGTQRSLVVVLDTEIHVRSSCKIVHHWLLGSGAGSITALSHLANVVTCDNVGLTSCVLLLSGDLGSVRLGAARVSLACPCLRRLLSKKRSRTLHNLLLFNLEPISLFTRNESALIKPRHIVWDLDGPSSIHHQVSWGGADLVLVVRLHLLLLLS